MCESCLIVHISFFLSRLPWTHKPSSPLTLIGCTRVTRSATALPATASEGLLALIGGSSFLKSQHLQSFQKAIVSTKFGNVLVHRGTGG